MSRGPSEGGPLFKGGHMDTTIDDSFINLRIDKRKGTEPSGSGKMNLLVDTPRGWEVIDKASGLKISINIGYAR